MLDKNPPVWYNVITSKRVLFLCPEVEGGTRRKAITGLPEFIRRCR